MIAVLLAVMVSSGARQFLTYSGAVLLTLLGGIPGVLAYRASRLADSRANASQKAANSVESRKADREELELAITEWRLLFEGVKAELATERLARRALEVELAEARAQISRLSQEKQ